MIKELLQKELLEKVKPGTKPSQLKRSKSAGDISVKEVKTLNRSKSAQELEPSESSLKAQLTQAQDQISILELKLETQVRELTELNSLSADNERLKEKLESKNTELSQVKAELDKSLEARHQSLKD
jgi:hypothetical protein